MKLLLVGGIETTANHTGGIATDDSHRRHILGYDTARGHHGAVTDMHTAHYYGTVPYPDVIAYDSRVILASRSFPYRCAGQIIAVLILAYKRHMGRAQHIITEMYIRRHMTMRP